jgi:IS66 C-terminal element
MDTKHEDLTAAEHVERAQSQGQSANLYSLVSCARVNGLEPYASLRYLFEESPKATTADTLEALLPWNVRPVMQGRQCTPAASSTTECPGRSRSFCDIGQHGRH